MQMCRDFAKNPDSNIECGFSAYLHPKFPKTQSWDLNLDLYEGRCCFSISNELQGSQAHSRKTYVRLCNLKEERLVYINRVKVSAITNSSEHLQPGLSGCRCNLWDTRCSSGPYKASEWSPLIGQSLCPVLLSYWSIKHILFPVWWYDAMYCIYDILESAQVL